MANLEMGLAVRDITPAVGVPMWGYSARTGPAVGTLDSLYAKALVFRAGDDTAALVVLDLGRVPTDPVCDRIRERARQCGVPAVMFSAIHTHHGPVMEEEDQPYIQPIERAIGDAIEAACENLSPVRIGYERVPVDIGHNRRHVTPDGRCYMRWGNRDRVPTEPVDREATVIRIDSEDGKPRAILVHYACHPVVMGPANRHFSADYVGELTRNLKERTGAEAIFLQGAPGDINPFWDKTPDDENAPLAMREVGRTFAEEILAIFGGIATAAPTSPAVAYSEKPITVGTRWDFTDAGQRALFMQFNPGIFNWYIRDIAPDLAVPLSVLVLNRELALVGIPGEPFVQFQLELKATAPLHHTLLCGYANGYYAYFPTIRDALAGGYGGTVGSYVGLGACDKLVQEAKLEIAHLLGRLAAPCSPQDFQYSTVQAQ